MADRRLAVITGHINGGGGGNRRAPPPFCPKELNKALLVPHGHYEVRQQILEFLKVGEVWGLCVCVWRARLHSFAPIAIGVALCLRACACTPLPTRPAAPFLRDSVG